MKAFSHDPRSKHAPHVGEKVSASHGGSASLLFPSKHPHAHGHVPSQLLLETHFWFAPVSVEESDGTGALRTATGSSVTFPATCCAAAISTNLQRHYAGIFHGDGTALLVAPARFVREFSDLFHVIGEAGMRITGWTRLFHGVDWSHSLFYLTLLLWTRRMSGLADFSSKSKILETILET